MMTEKVLLVAVVLVFSTSLAWAGVDDLEVAARVSWMTPAQPEVHLLLKNPTDKPIEFSLWLGRGRGKRKTTCRANLSTVDPNFYQRFDRNIGISRVMTEGVVPAKGWTHRSYLVGASGGVAPCEVPFTLGSNGKTIEGEVSIPEERETGRPAPSAGVSLTWERVIEESRVADDSLIVRLLVRNRGTHPIWASITARELSCRAGAISWRAHYGTIQGEAVGPAVVQPGEWIVFADVVDLAPGQDPKECSARLQISVLTEGGLRNVELAEFDLKPAGEFGVPNVRGK
jgi:hypothetical protein